MLNPAMSSKHLILVCGLLFLVLLIDLSGCVRIYKSRRKVVSLLSGNNGESQQFFSKCDQSSDVESCIMAYDSSVSDEYSQCAHTKKEKEAKWRGYLENPVYITTVHILNTDWRRLGMKDGLLEFTISGNGEVCHTHSSTTSFLSKTFPCDILTSYVEIKSSLDDAALVLCDVKVHGVALKFPTVLQYPIPQVTIDNCDQSSVHGTNNCWFASDGNYQHQKANQGYCAMTQQGDYEYWSGSFETPAIVQEVIIYGRTDCCQDQLANLVIQISDQTCARYNEAQGFDQKRFRCNIFGGGVRIQLMSRGTTLTVCEVQVYGHVVAMTPEMLRTYKGCYKDKPDDPDLSDYKDPVSLSSMQLNKCDRMCRRLGKRYFGVQEGMMCWCGSSYGKHGKLPDADCSMPCEGKHLQHCGGVNANRVFELL